MDKLKQAILLTNDDPKIDQPPGFKPLENNLPHRLLFDHQLTMCYRLIQQEINPIIITQMYGREVEVKTNRLLLNDYVSAGKTTEIIALQSMKKEVETHRDYTPENGDFEYGYLFEQETQIKTNVDLMIVPKHLIKQWINEYSFAYNLNVLVISTIEELNNIRIKKNITDPNCKLIDKNELDKIESYYELDLNIIQLYDVMLITDEIWRISWFELEFYQNKTKQLKWKRIIMDELDSIQYPPNLGDKLKAHLIAYFWYYITATPQRLTKNNYWFLQERHFKSGAQHITYDMLNLITIKNCDEYVKKSIEMPIPIRLFYDVITPSEIEVFKHLIPAQILEMINAGNTTEAIKMLNYNIVPDNKESVISIITKNIDHGIEQCKKSDDPNKNSKLAKLYLKKIELKKRIMESNDSLCPICLSDFETKCIVSCCGIMYCYECFAITRGEIKSNKCPNCYTILNTSDIKIISDDIDNKKLNKLNEKIDVFEKIMTSEDFNTKKYLIFANYEITINTISNKLSEINIPHRILDGKEDTIDEYKNGSLNVLLLNSTAYCAGLNLPNTTDIIIYHRHDINIEEQIIGRAQRLDRIGNLKIHYLVNNTEKQNLTVSNIYKYQDENGFDYNEWIIDN